ncbi:uncharacterized protein RJT21DRAFT_4920 [Scheffersomyces amazonensis]|uniref:uncharacterized protein n=1 Tax=Scheffersomyces amazonensis TaxID=1078765 RepID=UPI00315DAF5F
MPYKKKSNRNQLQPPKSPPSPSQDQTIHQPSFISETGELKILKPAPPPRVNAWNSNTLISLINAPSIPSSSLPNDQNMPRSDNYSSPENESQLPTHQKHYNHHRNQKYSKYSKPNSRKDEIIEVISSSSNAVTESKSKSVMVEEKVEVETTPIVSLTLSTTEVKNEPEKESIDNQPPPVSTKSITKPYSKKSKSAQLYVPVGKNVTIRKPSFPKPKVIEDLKSTHSHQPDTNKPDPIQNNNTKISSNKKSPVSKNEKMSQFSPIKENKQQKKVKEPISPIIQSLSLAEPSYPYSSPSTPLVSSTKDDQDESPLYFTPKQNPIQLECIPSPEQPPQTSMPLSSPFPLPCPPNPSHILVNPFIFPQPPFGSLPMPMQFPLQTINPTEDNYPNFDPSSSLSPTLPSHFNPSTPVQSSSQSESVTPDLLSPLNSPIVSPPPLTFTFSTLISKNNLNQPQPIVYAPPFFTIYPIPFPNNQVDFVTQNPLALNSHPNSDNFQAYEEFEKNKVDKEIIEKITKQLAYYFSTENLCKDLFLRRLFNNKNGGVELKRLIKFNKIKYLTNNGKDINLLRKVIRENLPQLELIDSESAVRIIDYEKWLIPPKVQ